MILVLKKLDVINFLDIARKTKRDVVSEAATNYSDIKYIDSVILDTRPFDVTQYPNLKVISRVGVGVDNIDLEECKKRNIKVYTTPCPELIRSVAEFTIKQLLNLMSIDYLRGDLLDKKVLIVGNGLIGYVVGKLLRFLGCNVFFYDVLRDRSHFNTHEELINWLPKADIVSVHVSGTDCVLGKKEIDLLKDNCYVLNMARQGCVDTNYLYNRVLVDGKNIKYASDVDDKLNFGYENYLLKDVLITPHIASKTVAARKAMENMALDNLVRGLKEQ